MRKSNSTILMPGQLLWDKGCLEFVQAAAYLHDHDITFVLLAPAPRINDARYVQKDQLLCWTGCGLVRWQPYQYHQNLLSQLHSADVIALPYRYPEQRQSRGMCRLALMLGVPVVTSLPGLRAKHCVPIPPDDGKALAVTIQKVCAVSHSHKCLLPFGDNLFMND